MRCMLCRKENILPSFSQKEGRCLVTNLCYQDEGRCPMADVCCEDEGRCLLCRVCAITTNLCVLFVMIFTRYRALSYFSSMSYDDSKPVINFDITVSRTGRKCSLPTRE